MNSGDHHIQEFLFLKQILFRYFHIYLFFTQFTILIQNMILVTMNVATFIMVCPHIHFSVTSTDTIWNYSAYLFKTFTCLLHKHSPIFITAIRPGCFYPLVKHWLSLIGCQYLMQLEICSMKCILCLGLLP